jgi:hypothetical protein
MLQSQEQSLKPFGLRITGMALSNQLPAFFSLLQVNLKFSHRILPNRTIPKDDLPRLAKSQKMTNPVWPNPGVTDIGHIPAGTCQNLKRGFDETSSLIPSPGDNRFRKIKQANSD